MRPIPFSKYEGCGNDFILIDNRTQFFKCEGPEGIRNLCHRRLGIGADGLILLEESLCADFRMRIFNADGSEAEMCGNGLRCCIKFFHEHVIKQNEYCIETMHMLLTGRVESETISVEMGDPIDIRLNIPIDIQGQSFTVHHIDTGVPHLILFNSDPERFPLEALGGLFRHHPAFFPKGANFNVAKITPQGEIIIRTYERGVEAETLACGTGCVAVAIAAGLLHQTASPIKVHTRSGALLISFDAQDGNLVNVKMLGPADKIFTGLWCGQKHNSLNPCSINARDCAAVP